MDTTKYINPYNNRINTMFYSIKYIKNIYLKSKFKQ